MPWLSDIALLEPGALVSLNFFEHTTVLDGARPFTGFCTAHDQAPSSVCFAWTGICQRNICQQNLLNCIMLVLSQDALFVSACL